MRRNQFLPHGAQLLPGVLGNRVAEYWSRDDQRHHGNAKRRFDDVPARCGVNVI